MEYKKIENWIKDNNYQNSGLRTDRNHRIDLYLSDVLYHYSKETVLPLESRIKELESEKSTELITEKEDYYGAITNITITKCCGIGPITNENFCPNCGRKIIKK